MTNTASVAVIIVSKGRPLVLKETLACLSQQTTKASQYIVVVTCDNDLPPQDRPDFIEFHIGNPGTCRQRNCGLGKIRPGTDYVAFFDDDMELRADYLEKAVKFLDSCPSVVGMSGKVLSENDDSRPNAKKRIAEFQPSNTYSGAFVRDVKYAILYGCGMIMRMSVMQHERFDENLPLYGFGEDYDISMRLRRYGIIGRYEECISVHLKSVGGRVNEVQRGYSIVANNWYFLRKGVTHLPPTAAYMRFWSVIVVRHLLEILWLIIKGDKPASRARLALGCLIGAGDVILGRSSPERMLDFSK